MRFDVSSLSLLLPRLYLVSLLGLEAHMSDISTTSSSGLVRPIGATPRGSILRAQWTREKLPSFLFSYPSPFVPRSRMIRSVYPTVNGCCARNGIACSHQSQFDSDAKVSSLMGQDEKEPSRRPNMLVSSLPLSWEHHHHQQVCPITGHRPRSIPVPVLGFLVAVLVRIGTPSVSIHVSLTLASSVARVGWQDPPDLVSSPISSFDETDLAVTQRRHVAVGSARS